MNIVPFTADMLAEAGKILSERHASDRQIFPQLPPRFEEQPDAQKAVQTVFEKPTSLGFAAISNDTMLAYLLGETSVQSWGRCGHIYMPGSGLRRGADARILQDLYAQLGEHWNQAGCFLHYIYLGAADERTRETWFDLGFGKERADALLDLRNIPTETPHLPEGIHIRRVTKEDGPHLAALSGNIWRQQCKAPRWHPMTPEDIHRQAPGWAEVADTPTDIAFLAMDGDAAVGSLAFYSEDERDDDMTIPPQCRYMTMAGTSESHRGRGIATALTLHGLQTIREHGDAFCLTNWQTANLLAARFWPRFGFTPCVFRLARSINPAIAWANGAQTPHPAQIF